MSFNVNNTNHLVLGVTVSLFFSAGLEIISCSNSFKSTLPFCSEHVFVYVENSVFFKYRRVMSNFKTHMKNLNSYF